LKKEDWKAVLRRTYKAVVQFDERSLEKVLFLSRVLIHLWNIAREEAERWLREKEKAITAYSFNYWLTAVRRETVTLVVGKGRTRLGLAKTEGGTSAQHYGAQNTGYLFRQLIYLRNKTEERGIMLVELPDPEWESDREWWREYPTTQSFGG
jgi:hypothetical protein